MATVPSVSVSGMLDRPAAEPAAPPAFATVAASPLPGAGLRRAQRAARYAAKPGTAAEAAARVLPRIADPARVAVGGHSYGAFMTANLLAHSRLFRAGFAESGAYNRSLTPFGFQSERRTFWEVPDLYAKMSPFWYANQIKDPILLMHGEADDNSGTFPIQSERFYMALKGHGATVRYETLPFEAHGYAGRETLLHILAERINWFDKYVKNAATRADEKTAAK